MLCGTWRVLCRQTAQFILIFLPGLEHRLHLFLPYSSFLMFISDLLISSLLPGAAITGNIHCLTPGQSPEVVQAL